jgi:hypothetical protein
VRLLEGGRRAPEESVAGGRRSELRYARAASSFLPGAMIESSSRLIERVLTYSKCTRPDGVVI